MTGSTVAAEIGAAPLAIAEMGLPWLARELPKEEAQFDYTAFAGAPVKFERGQRFAVVRGIALVPIRGILTPNSSNLEKYLGWSTYQGIEQTMQAVASDTDVRAVVMLFDSPGGSVVGLQGAVQAVRRAASLKPVHALVYPLAASAGYWLASPCTDISLAPGAWVGSVGTMTTSSQPMQPGSGGDQTFIQVSSHAGAKRPDLSSEKGSQLAQLRLDQMEAEFLEDVATGRKIPLEDVPGRMSRTQNDADGGDVFWGEDALKRGLVDRVETMPDFISRIGGAYAPPPRKTTSGFAAQAAAAKALAAI